MGDEKMSEQTEYVEVTVKIPKQLMNVLVAESFFGWSQDDFFGVSIQRSISCEVTSMPLDEANRIRNRYGDIDTVKHDIKKFWVPSVAP
jgi:hypothetical protein